jgi:transcriptional regulator with XRE-family HTH domain
MVDRPGRQPPAGPVGFGVLLRSLRERALVSQEELAARAGVSVRAIGNLEQGGVGQPRGASVRLLADALGLVGPERRQFEDAARQRFEDAGRPVPEARRGVGGVVAVNHPTVSKLADPDADCFATRKSSFDHTFSGQNAVLTYWHRPLCP